MKNNKSHSFFQILDGIKIHLIPTLNPDGLQKSKGGNCDSSEGHGNTHGVDLDETFYCKYFCFIFLLN